ncbi:MAG: GtrA family protein [Leptospirales bacterium]|nr:GtrA family protein [Leptospirales bacterium]
MWTRLMQLLDTKLFRYGIAGSATFAVNMGAMYVLMEWVKLNATDLESNISHFLSTEISILFSFHAHSFFTWKERQGHYLKRLWHFHLLTGLTIILRQIGFHFLSEAGYHWVVATLVPLAIAIVINFLGYDKLVFRAVQKKPQTGE